MDILGQSSLIIALASFALAITALSRNLRNKLVITFAGLCTVISGWGFFFFFQKIFDDTNFYRAHLTFNLLIAPVAIFFISVLTRLKSRFLVWLYRISLIYTVVGLVVVWSGVWHKPWALYLVFLAPSFILFGCLQLMLNDWRLKKGILKRAKAQQLGLNRRTWIYVGAMLLLLTATMDHFPFLGDGIPSLGNIFLGLYLFLISEAIIHQRLLNISALFTKVLVLSLISICVALIYVVFLAWIENSPALFFLNTLFASFITILLVEPFKQLANIAVIKILNQKYLKFDSKVTEAQTQLVGILDIQGLAQLSLNFLVAVLGCESASFFTLRSDGTKYKRVRGLRDENLMNREILVSHPLIEFFTKIKRRGDIPVILDQYLINEIDRSTSQAQKQSYDTVLKGLSGLNANIAIPFLYENIILGFVVVRASEPPEPWGNNWGILSVIYPFFEQAARTLKNMDVYVRLREKERLAALGEMAAGLAHEIRNPLGAIKGAAQYIAPQSEGTQAEFLKIIIEEVNRLNKVVSQFLDYSKPQQPELKTHSIFSILEKTLLLLAKSNPVDQNIKLELIEPNQIKEMPAIDCEPEQLKQVLVNLIQNAMQSGATSIQVGVILENRVRDNRSEIVIYVEDNGRGIAKENLDKIFIPFFTTSPSGTGLGLPICARIIEAHGGRIEVLSEENKFTRFLVYLPVPKK